MFFFKVYEASCGEDGFVDTSRVHPILIQSLLPIDVLGGLWDMSNKKVPGKLDKIELFTLLGLISLYQVYRLLKFKFLSFIYFLKILWFIH